MSKQEREQRFVERHEDEIAPLMDNPSNFLAELGGKPSQKWLDQVIERFETRAFLYENPQARPDAKGVIIDASEPLAWNIDRSLLGELLHDERCARVLFLTDNVAAKAFEQSPLASQFDRLHDHQKPLLGEIMEATAKEKFHVALALVEPQNSPNLPLLFGAKSVFGVEKLYFVIGGWVGVGAMKGLFDSDRARNFDALDGILCNDELAALIIAAQLPYYKDKLRITGTPIIDGLDLAHAKEHRQQGREKLGIDENTLTCLYAAGISAEDVRSGFSIDPRLNEKIFEQMLEALSKQEGPRDMALLVRPHPRDPNAQEYLDIAKHDWGALRVIPATAKEITMQEAGYASDVIASVASTENFLQRLRGGKAVFLGFTGLSDTILHDLYPPESMQAIINTPNLQLVSSPEELGQYLQTLHPGLDAPQIPQTNTDTSAKRILDISLA